MFKVYDSNFKEVKIPVDRLGFGSRALEINVGPVIYENVYSQSRRADTLVKRYAKDRQVSIVLMVSGMDETDFRMKRDELYSFFRNLGIFFVAEEQQPFKLIKVIVNDDYDIDRQTPEIAMPEIPLKIIDTPFKQSLHTTGTIGSEGMLFNNKWGYGMGTWFAENYWQYEFSGGKPPNENLLGDSDKSYNNANSNIANYPIKEDISVGEKVTVSIYGELGSGRLAFGLYNTSASSADYMLGTISSVAFDDGLGAYVGTFSWPVGGNTELRVFQTPSSATSSSTIDKIKLERGNVATNENSGGQVSNNHKVTFFNAGDEEVKLIQQKESLITLKINAVPTNGLIDIDDGTTTFKLWYDFKVGDVLRIHGDKVTLNGKNVLGDTNFNFLTVKRGWNYWDVRGIPNRDYEFKIDFRYLYD